MNFIDLFAGAGGLSEGFIRAGYTPIAHVESDAAACFTLKTRAAFHYLKLKRQLKKYERYLKGEITREQLYSYVPDDILDSIINAEISDKNNPEIFSRINSQLNGQKVDLIIGGPPCQAYSLIGRAADKNKMRDDPRNHLYIQYAHYLEKYQPKLFVFENVLGLRSAGDYLNKMKALFAQSGKGYHLHDTLLNAKDFGVLQDRRRVIILGWQQDIEFVIPKFKPIQHNFKVADVLNDLPFIRAGEGKEKYLQYKGSVNKYLERFSIRNGIEILTQHKARPNTEQDKEIYRIAVEKWKTSKERLKYPDLPLKLRTHKNETAFLDRFKVVGDEEPSSHTVVAHVSKDGHYYIHPDARQNRSLTVREVARLQSFPDDYFFEGEKEGKTQTSAFKQIGNAVPPLLAFSIARKLKCHFFN